MIVYAKYEPERDMHIINSIDGDMVRSVSFYNTDKGKRIVKDWSHRIDELGIRSIDKYVDILKKRGFVEVKSA